MRLGLAAVILVSLAIPVSGRAIGAGSEAITADERTVRAAGLLPQGPALLDFFRKRTLSEVDQAKVLALIRQLGDAKEEKRLVAAGALVSLGPMAIPLLRQAVKDPDEPEIMKGAQQCLRCIEGASGAAIPAAAARLVAIYKPAGAAEVLLAYLPFADNDQVGAEVQAALAAVAVADGQPDKALVAALTDEVPARRAAAAVALSQAAGPSQIAIVQRLLRDPKPTVRLQAALALATLKEQTAIPVLIELLAELPPNQAREAEEFLTRLAGEQAPVGSAGADEAMRSRRQAAWRTWWRSVDGLELLTYFRKRTLSDAERDRILSLIRQLGDDSFAQRERASEELLALGSDASALLRQAAASSDTEIARRVQQCLAAIEKGKGGGLSQATAARLLAFRKPAGAAETLLAFLPFTNDDTVTEAVQEALCAVAWSQSQIDPALIEALDDPLSLRRAVAAEVLCQVGGAAEREAAGKLLADPDPSVRFRVAVARLALQDRDAVPVLIALLTEGSTAQTWRVEEILNRLAGDQAPAQPAGTDEATRSKARAAWNSWWLTRGAQVDLGKLDVPERQLGHTLIVLPELGRVLEVGPDGQPRWQIEGLRTPYDAWALPGDRVLVAEYQAQRVTERNLKGDILWEKVVPGWPLACQRLANGNTFIVTRNQVFEVDRDGKEVFTYSRPGLNILAAHRARNGETVLATTGSTLMRLNASGKLVKSFSIGPFFQGFATLDMLPNGRVLVPQLGANKVVEYDGDGKVVWQVVAMQPTSATRLPNGNTLVASQLAQNVQELDRNGKVVWEYKVLGHRPWRAHRR